MIAPEIPGLEVIEETLDLLMTPGEVHELRVLMRPEGVASGNFRDHHRMAQVAMQANLAGHNTYLTINPILPEIYDRPKEFRRPVERAQRVGKGQTTDDGQIAARRWVFFDCDPRRPDKKQPSSDSEHNAAVETAYALFNWLQDFGFSSESLVLADSGNGAHVLLRADLENSREDHELVKRCLKAVAFEFSSDRVEMDLKMANAARVTKLYGTTARKGEETADRPHRESAILLRPERPVPADRALLEQLADRIPPPPPKPEYDGPVESFDIDRFVEQHLFGVVVRHGPWEEGGYRWILSPCPWNPEHDDNAAYVLRMPSGAVVARCHHNGCEGREWRDLREMYEPRQERPVDDFLTPLASLPELQESSTTQPIDPREANLADPAAEKAVLGACLCNENCLAIVSGILKQEHYATPEHGRLYGAILALWEASEPRDEITLARLLGGPVHLGEFRVAASPEESVAAHAEIVRDLATRRAFVAQLRQSALEAKKLDRPLAEVLTRAEDRVIETSSHLGAGNLIHLPDIAQEMYSDIASRTEDVQETGIPTGLLDLDHYLGGLHRERMYVLAARPGMYKTALALHILAEQAAHGYSVLFFSIEMSGREIADRILAMRSGVAASRIAHRKLTEEELSKVRAGVREMSQMKFTIIDEPDLKLADMIATCRRHKVEHGLDVFSIDYLQKMSAAGEASKVQEVAAMSTACKKLCRQLDVAGLILSQLNRKLEEREDRHPIMSDLRDSGQVEQDADAILFNYYDAHYNKASDTPNLLEIEIAKNRQGRQGARIQVLLEQQCFRFKDLAPLPA